MKRLLLLTCALLTIVGGVNYLKAAEPDVNGKTFTLQCARGYVNCTSGQLSSTKDASAASAFAIVSYESNTYLYDATNKAFVCHTETGYTGNTGNRALEDTSDFSKIVKGLAWGETNIENYPFYLKESEYNGWLNMNGSQVLFNRWTNFEGGNGGNTYKVEPVEEFNDTEAVAMLDAYYHPSATVTYVISDARGVVFTSNAYNASIGTTITTLPNNLQRNFCSYNVPSTTLMEGSNTVYVTVTYNLPFEISTDYDNATWYHMALQENKYPTYSPTGTPNVTLPTTYTQGDDNTKWAFIGNPYNGFSIINKAAGASLVLGSASPNGDGNTGGNTYATLGSGQAYEKYFPESSTYYTGGFFLFTAEHYALNFRSNNNLAYWTGGYNAGSTFTVSEAPAATVDVTYNVAFNGVIVKTATETQGVGNAPALPTSITSPFATYTYNVETITASTTTVTATATWTGPFSLSTSYESATWQNLYLNDKRFYAHYQESAPYYTTTATPEDKLLAADVYQWAFVGNPYSVKVYNKAAGNTKTLNSNDPQTVMAEGEYEWTVGKSGSGFSLQQTKYINLYGGTNAANPYMGLWANATTLFASDVPDIPVTNVYFDVYFNGSTAPVTTATVAGLQVGDDIPEIPSSLNRDYVTLSHNTTGTVTKDMHINVTATWSAEAPFQLADSYENAKWQNMAVRSTWYVTSDNVADDGALQTVNANAYGLGSDAYQWAFVGDPWHVRLYNKDKGHEYVYAWTGTNNGTIPAFVASTSENYWQIKASTSSISNSFMLTIPTMGYQVNQFGGEGGTLKIWSAIGTTDAGSAFTVFDVPTDYAQYVVSEISPYMESTNTYFNWTEASRTAIGYNVSYKTTCSYETYKGLKDAIAARLGDMSNFVLPETGYYRIKSNMYGSYMRQTGSVVRGNDNGNADKDAASVVYLTRDANNNYSFRIQGSYIQAPTAASVEVTKGDDPGFFITEIAPNRAGLATFWGNSEVSHSALHSQAYGGYYNQPGSLVGWERNAEASWWSIEEAETFNITLNGPVDGKYYATLCVPFDVTVEGATAYTLTKGEGSELTMTEAAMVPAGTPVVLVGTSASATCIIGEGYSAAISTSTALTGSYLEIASFDGANNYVLGTDGTKAGFFHWTGSTLKANRAYVVGEAAGGADEVKGFYLNLDGADGVKNVDLNVNLNDKVYDLSGRRVSQPTRGLYIVNGKKVAVK